MRITAIKAQVKRAGRFSIFVDDKYSFSLSDTALFESKLTVGQELSKEDIVTYKRLSAEDKIYGQTLQYIALRPRSTGELNDYFRRKDVSSDVQQKILNKLTEHGLINDHAFAESWVNSRRMLKHTSRRRLAQELRQKRVSDDIIREVLAEDEMSDETALRELIARKRRQTKYQDTMKLMQYLARQGFQYDDIKRALSEDSDSL